MAGALIFSLAMAGIGLLVFGEMMGLPAGFAAFGVASILGAVLVAAALAGATSRLGRFVTGAGKGTAIAFGAVAALLIVLGYFVLGIGGRSDLSVFFWLVVGFCISQLVLPANPWALPAEVSPGNIERLARSDSLRGAVPVTMLSASAGAAVLFAMMLPGLAERLVEASGWPLRDVTRVLIGLICALALIGGVISVRRAALIGLAFAAVLLILPGTPDLLRVQFPQSLDGDVVRQFAADAFGRLTLLGSSMLRAPDIGALATGGLIGLVALQPAGAVTTPLARSGARMLAILLAGMVIAVLEANNTRLQILMAGSFIETAPSQWPVFVYSDVLRGWLSACGTWPDEARQAALACGRTDPRALLPSGALQFDKGLAMPALAASSGLPVILGFLWALLPLVLVLVAGAMALLTAATGFAEVLRFPRERTLALRSTRLARIRLAVLSLTGLALAMSEAGYRVDGPIIQWLTFSVCFLVGATTVAGWLIRLLRMFSSRSRTEAIDNSGAQTCAG